MSATAPAGSATAVGLVGAGAAAAIARDRFRYQELGDRRDAECRADYRCGRASLLFRWRRAVLAEQLARTSSAPPAFVPLALLPPATAATTCRSLWASPTSL